MRINSFVVFDRSSCSIEVYEKYYGKIFGEKLFVFLGEIPQCPGHCILADLFTGRVIGMYHTENFREATENEI